MGEFDTLNTLLSGEQPAPVAATPAAPETAPAPAQTAPATTDPAQPAAGTAAVPAQPEGAPADTVTNPDQVFDNPKNKAFAQMRIQNTQMSGVINRLATVLGLDKTTEPEQLISVLEQRIMATEAQQSNIPVEIYQKLQQAEQMRVEQEQAMLKQQASLAFKNVKDTFKLTDQQLTAFAQQLYDDGKNPYLTPMDLVTEYRNLNFEKILAAEREKAIQEALARDKKATNQSTAPSAATGRPSEPPTRIESIAGLNALLNTGN